MSKYLEAWHNPQTDEVHTPKGRILYPALIEPRAMKDKQGNSGKPKFSVTLLIPKEAKLDALRKLAAEKAEAEFGKDWSQKINRNPFLKTENFEKLADYKDAFPTLLRLSANTEFPPFIFGPNAKPFDGKESEIYSGRWAVAALRAYAYNQMGNRGVAFGLQRIQLLDHDEPINAGRVATASGFEAVEAGAAPGGIASSGGSADDLWG